MLYKKLKIVKLFQNKKYYGARSGPLSVKQFTATADDDEDDDNSFNHSSTRRPVTVKPILPVKHQYAVTHTIPASASSSVTNTPVKM